MSARVATLCALLAGCAAGGKATTEESERLPSESGSAVLDDHTIWGSCRPLHWAQARPLYPPLNYGGMGSQDVHLPDDRLLLQPGDVIYDPHADKYEFLPGFESYRVAELLDPPRMATISLMPGGRYVLASGGGWGDVTASSRAWMIDLVGGVAAPIHAMALARAGHWQFTLPNGKVLVVGDREAIRDPKSELYDPDRDQWSDVPVPPGFLDADDEHNQEGIYTASAAQLANGDIFATPTRGGICSSTYRYNWQLNTWMTWPSRPENSAPADSVVLADGRVLVTGTWGCGGVLASDIAMLRDAWIFDPSAETWTPAAPMNHRRVSHSTALLPCGRVLAVGGQTSYPYSDPSESDVHIAEIYDPENDVWYDLPGSGPFLLAAKPTLVLLNDGSVFVAYGQLQDPGTNVPQPRPLFLR